MFNTFLSTFFSFIILFFSIFNIRASNCNECNLPLLEGTFPQKLCSILKKDNFNTGSNRLLLHGPGGNGKTSIPEIIAAFHCTELKQVSAAQIMSRFVSESATNMRNVFTNEGFQKTELAVGMKSGLKVVRRIIFIDEVDLIASVNTSEFRSEHEATKKEFWQLLDKFEKMEKEKDKGPFFIICATNRYDLLDPNFVSRFGGNVVEVPNPGALSRSAALKKFSECLFSHTDETLANWTQATEGFSMRDLKKFVQGVHERTVDNNNHCNSSIIDEEMQVIRNKVEAQRKLAAEKNNADYDAEHRKLSIQHFKESIEQMKQTKEERKKDAENRIITQVAVKAGAVIASGGSGYAVGATLHTVALTVAKASILAGPFGHVMLPIWGGMMGVAIILDNMPAKDGASSDDKSKKS